MKRRGLSSPDLADCLAMTLAVQVAARTFPDRTATCGWETNRCPTDPENTAVIALGQRKGSRYMQYSPQLQGCEGWRLDMAITQTPFLLFQ
jgi:hypothetical protein